METAPMGSKQLREMAKLAETEGRYQDALFATRAADRAQRREERAAEERERRYREIPHEVTYTTAPAAYDWFHTEQLESEAGKQDGKVFRKVVSPVNELWAQRSRYASGNHAVLDEGDYTKLKKAGLIS